MAQVQEPVVTFDRRSTQRTRPATVAGLCYLAVIAGGLFAEGMVRGSLVVPGDAAATASAILENETLWRLGLAVHLLYLIPALAVNVIVSGLFRSMEPTLARLGSAAESLHRLVGERVDELRRREVSWTTIGDTLGISRQAAWERFS